MRRLLKISLFIIMVLGFTGCNSTETEVTTNNSTLDTTSTEVDELSKTLMNIYNLASESGSFDGTYEEWLDTIRGEQGLPGEDGQEVVMRVNNSILEWKYTDDTSWVSLFDFSSLNGDDGLDGENGEDGKQIEIIIQDNLLKWRYDDSVSWNTLIDLSVLVTLGKTSIEIGDNYNWWIDGIDTGISASGSYTDNENVTDGLRFQMISYDGEYGYEVVAYEGTDPIVYIPNIINDMPVISIANDVFYSNDIIQEVNIPKNLKRIGRFEESSNLTTINIPIDSELVEIIDRAFYNCDWLEEITIPNNVTKIGNHAFYDCDSLKVIKLGEKVRTLGEYAFYSCENIEYFEFNDVLEVVGDDCFYYSNAKVPLLIPESVTHVGYRAFYNSGINLVYCEIDQKPDTWNESWINNNLVRWGVNYQDGYLYQTNLLSATIVGYIGEEVDLEVPSSLNGHIVNKLGDYALAPNVLLKTIKLPDTLNEIGTNAIRYTPELLWVYVPNSVSTVSSDAFGFVWDMFDEVDCLETRIYIESNSKPTEWADDWNTFLYDDGYQYSGYYFGVGFNDFGTTDHFQYYKRDNEIHITGYVTRLNEIIIPDQIEGLSVTSVEEFAFFARQDITRVIIGSNVTDIEKYAFGYSRYIQEVTLNDGLINIGNYAFADLESLLYLEIPDTVILIGEYAFTDCHIMVAVYIPNSVYVIGQYAFDDCYDLTIYTSQSEKAAGWDSTWNQENRPVEWGTEISNLVYEDGFVGLVINNQLYIARYTLNENLVIIPSNLSGYNVKGIKTNAFDSGSLPSYAKIVIPNSIDVIEYHAFDESYLYIYLEDSSIPTSWDTNWYTGYNIYVYANGEWTYDSEGIPQTI